MNLREAIAWLSGERTHWKEISLIEDGAVGIVQCAEADAASVQQAYWVLRAAREFDT